MNTIETQAKMITNDVADFYISGILTIEGKNKIKNIYEGLIEDHKNDVINIFDYNDDKFYEWFVS